MANRALYVILIILLVAAAAGYYYWQSTQQVATTAAMQQASTIAATEIGAEQWQPTLHAIGTLRAVNGIDVSSEVSGIVSDIVFKSGQQVNKGQILLRLDDSVDRAQLEALRAERELAAVQFNRAKDLLKRNVTSKSEYDEAQASYDAARARVKQQEAIIERKTIRAPFAGLAGIRQVDLGQYIEAGQAFVSLQSLDPIYVDYNVAERHLSRIRSEQRVMLHIDAFPERRFEGQVEAIDSGIDTGTRTLQIRALLQNPDGLLRPGMFAQVETVTGDAETVLTLPRTAIDFNSYGNFVFVINDNGDDKLTVKRTSVETGESRDGRIAVSGMSEGTRVVRSGLVKLRDGMAVRIDNQIVLDDSKLGGE